MLLGNINAIPFRRRFGGGGDTPFPSIPGMVARYSGAGLTNEEMSKNPVWKDLMGNGHDLQMKNFAWGGMSGVGGYTENYNSNKWYKTESRIDVTWTYKSFNARSIKDNRLAQLFYQSSLSDTGFRVLSCTIKVSGLTDGQGIEYVSNGTQQFVIMRIENDGIYHLPSFDFGAKNAYYGFKFLKLQESCNITIEQLPLYPGALVFDGVDDYGVCDNFPILTKEINTYDLSPSEALQVKDRYPEWETGINVKTGERYRVEDVLWECVKDHLTQENWKPSMATASLWKVVDEEHKGTIDDPIVYIPPMEIFKDKYYIQNGIKYKCARNSEQPLTHDLSALVGLYVEKV